MTRAQQIVDGLFDQFPTQDLGGGPERYQFDRLREVLASAADWPSAVRRLYQAERCDELALSLLWLTDRIEADAARSEATSDEAEAFQRALRRSLGLTDLAFSGFGSESGSDSPTTLPIDDVSVEPLSAFESASSESPIMDASETPAVFETAAPETPTTDATSFAMPTEDDDGGTSDPEIYGRLLERFLESVQSGSEDRAELLGRLRANNRAVQGDSAAMEEFQRYTTLVDDFLGYIDEHQLLDDVRVMNLVANLQEPFGQWLSTDESSRAGILDQCVEMQRDFRTMFE